MGRIEDAIEKLQQRRAEDTGRQRSAQTFDPIARLAEHPKPGEQAYGGRHLEVDSQALQRHGLLAPEVRMRRIAEEYRAIKRPLVRNARVSQRDAVRLGNVIMVASGLSGEGKTFTCLNLSLSIAREKDWNVVLVDGDCSRPHLTRLFGAENEPGLLDLLHEPTLEFESIVMPTNLPGLSFLPAGSRDEQSAELLASDRMRNLCEQISAGDPQRILIFDSSPLLLTSEAQTLASQVGQVVFVVRANDTPRQAATSAIELLDAEKPIGAILNRQIGGSGVVGGYYGYGYGDSYGDDQ